MNISKKNPFVLASERFPSTQEVQQEQPEDDSDIEEAFEREVEIALLSAKRKPQYELPMASVMRNWLLFLAFCILIVFVTIVIFFKIHRKTTTILFDDLQKPESDSRVYRNFILPNGMHVLAISDPDTTKSSAAVALQVGSWEDSDIMPGQAHFLEHLLFMGSKKYPELDSLNKYVSKNGGSSNAFTVADQTNFHFEVSSSGFHQALDIFYNMFKEPIFKREWVDSEVEAIESEFQIDLGKQTWMLDFALKQISDQRHPYSRFVIGDKETLVTKPEASGVNIVRKITKFYNKYYAANLMTMVIIHNEPVQQIFDLAVEKFTHLPDKNINKPNYANFPKPFNQNNLQKFLQYAPPGNDRILNVMFQIDGQRRPVGTNPVTFIYLLISYAGQGSLNSYLKEKGWITSVSASPSVKSDDFEFASIDFVLTEEGGDHLEKIVEATFAYLDLIREKGITEALFKQLSYPQKYMFNYTQYGDDPSINSVIDETAELATNLHDFQSKSVLSGEKVMWTFDEDSTKALLSEINTSNMLISMADPLFMSEEKEKEVIAEYEKAHPEEMKAAKEKAEADKAKEKEGETGNATANQKESENINANEKKTDEEKAEAAAKAKTEDGAQVDQSDNSKENVKETKVDAASQNKENAQSDEKAQENKAKTDNVNTNTPKDEGNIAEKKIDEKAQNSTEKQPKKYLIKKSLDKWVSLYNLNYTTVDIPVEFLHTLNNTKYTEYPELGLPQPNKYWPKNFDLVKFDCKDNTAVDCVEKYDADRQRQINKVVQKEGTLTWHLMERSFGAPITIAKIDLQRKEFVEDIQYLTVIKVLSEAVNSNMTEMIDDMTAAGHAVSFGYGTLAFDCYSDAFSDIIKTVVKTYATLEVSEADFNTSKDSLALALGSLGTEDIASQQLAKLMMKHAFTQTDVKQNLEKLSFDDYKKIVADIRTSAFNEIFFYGNINEEQAKSTTDDINKILNYKQTYDKNLLPKDQVFNIKGKNLVYRNMSANLDGNMTVTTNYYQDGLFQPKNMALMKLLVNILAGEAFTVLRSEGKLGYVVSLSDVTVGNTTGLMVTVISSAYDSNKVDQEIEKFWGKAEEALNALDETKLSEIVTSLKSSLKFTKRAFRVRGNLVYSHIDNNDYIFDLESKYLDAMDGVTKSDLIEYLNALVKKPNKLSLQFYGSECKHIAQGLLSADDQYSKTEPKEIKEKDLEGFDKYPLEMTY